MNPQAKARYGGPLSKGHASQARKQRTSSSHEVSALQGHTDNHLRTFFNVPPLTALPHSGSATLGTKPLTLGPLGNFNILAIVQAILLTWQLQTPMFSEFPLSHGTQRELLLRTIICSSKYVQLLAGRFWKVLEGLLS